MVDQRGEVVATAVVCEREGRLTGTIDLAPMPTGLRQKFQEYEEIVRDQVFSLLDDIEQQIGAIPLTVLFDDGLEVPIQDLQIYPSARRVSFQVDSKSSTRRAA